MVEQRALSLGFFLGLGLNGSDVVLLTRVVLGPQAFAEVADGAAKFAANPAQPPYAEDQNDNAKDKEEFRCT